MINEPRADVREMYLAHTMFRREIGLAPALIRDVADGDIERAATVADHLQIVGNSLHHHQVAEDNQVWPRLAERIGADAEPVVRLMAEQHEAIDALLTEVRAGLARWRATADPVRGEALAAALGRLYGRLVEHLAVEEELALPLIEKHITAAEWAQVFADSAGDVPPGQLPLIVGMMAYEADPQLVRDIIAQLPGELSCVLGDLAPVSYAAHAQRVYGTSTPARIGARGAMT